LARKYLDALPKREAKPPVISSVPPPLPKPETEDIQTSKEVLTFSEAVQFTGYSESYLYKLTSERKIPHSKPTGKLIYFNRRELEAWLLQNRVSTTDEIAGKAQTYCMKNTKGKQLK
jgi:excisionase family DNA binding protein